MAFSVFKTRFLMKKIMKAVNQAGRSRKPWLEDCRKSFLTKTKR